MCMGVWRQSTFLFISMYVYIYTYILKLNYNCIIFLPFPNSYTYHVSLVLSLKFITFNLLCPHCYLCVRIYVYICVWMHIYVYIYKCMHTYNYVYIFTYICVCMYLCMCVYKNSCTYIFMFVCISRLNAWYWITKWGLSPKEYFFSYFEPPYNYTVVLYLGLGPMRVLPSRYYIVFQVMYIVVYLFRMCLGRHNVEIM